MKTIAEKWADNPDLAKEALRQAETIGEDMTMIVMDAVTQTITYLRDVMGRKSLGVLLRIREPDRAYVDDMEYYIGVTKELIGLLSTPTEGHMRAKREIQRWVTQVSADWQGCKDSLGMESGN